MTGLSQLQGRVAVVTGGASGIGRGIATRLVAAGMTVVIADIEPGALARTADEIGAVPIRTDVTDAASVQALADEIMRRFKRIDVVCNNAGVGSTGLIEAMSADDWKWVIDVNLWGVINGIRAFMPLLMANPEGGHVVNTSSMGGLGTVPTLGGYSATKFAVVAISEALAQEQALAGSKVGVTVLCPGTVKSNIKTSSRNRPAGQVGTLADTDLENSDFGAAMRWMDPVDVGDVVVAAIRAGDMYAFTHPEMGSAIVERHRRIEAALDAATARVPA